MKYLTWLWRNSQGERLNMGARVVVGVLQVALGLLTILLSKQFIDETIRVGSDQDIVKMIVSLVATVVGGVLCRQLNYYLNVQCCSRGTNRLRTRVFSRIFDRELFGKKSLHSGDVSSRVMKDVETVCNVTFESLPQMTVTVVQLVGAFLLMRWFDPRLAWILLLLTPFVLSLGKLISRRLRKMTAEIREGESRVQMHVQECAEHDVLIRSMESQGFVGGLLDNMQNRLMNRVTVRSRFTVVIRILLGLSFGLGYMLAFVWGGIGLRNGVITFGVMTSFLQLVGQIQHPIFNLLNMAPSVIHATASIDRIDEILQEERVEKTPLLNPEKSQEQVEPYESAGIRVDNVTFAYGDGPNVLDHVYLDFGRGKKIALMGETGAGKTTLFRLMLGLVKPNAGRVIIYSEDESRGVDGTTRKNFVFVPQGSSLFSGSVRLNMQMAKADVSDDEIWKALYTACADFVGDLPNGLDTELGERGFGLSEGQAERIAVARGLLQSGSVMLLDEISAALDAETEKEMFRRIFAAYPEKTMIFITHRDAVCDLCDEVIHL
ncbi:MAG: ABC transporter ATP-binding protein/permease [Fibrobacter sp.]|nr:ABC transporter ATP-binding protein/permease [Fibrobacter sp.]